MGVWLRTLGVGGIWLRTTEDAYRWYRDWGGGEFKIPRKLANPENTLTKIRRFGMGHQKNSVHNYFLKNC